MSLDRELLLRLLTELEGYEQEAGERAHIGPLHVLRLIRDHLQEHPVDQAVEPPF